MTVPASEAEAAAARAAEHVRAAAVAEEKTHAALVVSAGLAHIGPERVRGRQAHRVLHFLAAVAKPFGFLTGSGLGSARSIPGRRT